MTRRFATALLVALASPALAAPQAPVPVATPAETVRVVLTTSMGPITLALEAKRAPITTANFLRYVDQKRFDGIAFYRAMKLEWGTPPNGLIQAGTRGDPKRVLKPIAHEPTTKTGLSHIAGTISMARGLPGTASGDFTILLSDLTSLDADPKASGDNGGFAAFGHVVDGMDVVTKIFNAPINPKLGSAAMKGEMLAAPVKILTARRAKP